MTYTLTEHWICHVKKTVEKLFSFSFSFSQVITSSPLIIVFLNPMSIVVDNVFLHNGSGGGPNDTISS